MKTRNKKFCWLPQPVYSTRYYRDGFVWLGYAHIGIDGKWFRNEQFKPKAVFGADGRLKYVLTAKSWQNDPLMRQELEVYKIKCNGLPNAGLNKSIIESCLNENL
jgi:hypothetical protein